MHNALPPPGCTRANVKRAFRHWLNELRIAIVLLNALSFSRNRSDGARNLASCHARMARKPHLRSFFVSGWRIR